MAGKLVKLQGFPPGTYALRGGLDGITGPGRRTVHRIDATKLTAENCPDGLEPLRAFDELHELELDGITDLDLAPLTNLPLTSLRIRRATNVDLRILDEFPAPLEHLALISIGECALPEVLRLPSSLDILLLLQREKFAPSDVLVELVRRIDWTRLDRLTELLLDVDYPPYPQIDLGFVQHLTSLGRLDVWGLTDSAENSPLQPPYAGRPAGLENVRGIAADERMWELGGEVTTSEPWSIQDDGDGWWSAYGSFADAEDAPSSETEHAAYRRAMTKLKTEDPALHGRLEFDQEAEGTAIIARSQEDLERTLAILGLGATATDERA